MEVVGDAWSVGPASEELRAEALGGRRCSSAEEAALEVSWVQGFSNKNFGFINNQTVCYPCGNYILFLNIETKKTSALHCQTGQVGAFAVNGNSQVLAFSDRKLNPIIYIYNFPELNKLTELKGNAQLDYTLLAFSFTGPYLASYSSIPEFVLSVWNWQENIILCSESQPGVAATSLSFNPMNWQQLCFVNESSVTFWHIEKNNDEHHLKQNPVKLHDGQGSVSPHKELFFPVSHSEDSYYGPDLPVSAIAGLVGDEAETFMPRNYIRPSVHPTAHCWTATSEIYMACKEGYVLAISAETRSVSALQQKPLPEHMRKMSDVVSYVRREVQKKKGGKLKDLENRGFFAMAFCNKGLYAAGSEGMLFFYDIKGLQYEMKICADILQPISSLVFSPDYTTLLVVTDQGTIYTYKPAHSGEAVKLLDACSSCFLAADFLTPGDKYCVNMLEDPSVFLSEKRTPSNQFGSGFLCLSPNSRWLASAAKDGVLFIYHSLTMDILAQKHCHSYQGGGIRSMVFSLDGKFILVNGENDGALVCLKWKKIKKIEVKEAAFHWQSLLAVLNKSTLNENVVLKSMAEWQFDPESTSESAPEEKFKEAPLKSSNVEVTEEGGNITSSYSSSSNDMTWMGQKIQKVIREETQRFSNQKKELQMGIKKLRKTIQKMMHENEQVPDIEKLEQQEFNLDVEEQERAQAEAEQEVARVRKEIEMENLANRYLQDVIKHECWDAMCVKGRAVKCFHMAHEVKNYPLKKRSKEELETLEKVLQLKKIATADLKVQKNNVEIESETVLSKEEGEKAAEVMADGNASYCLVGSLSSQYGGDTSSLYHQWDLHSREQKVNQIVLLKDIIYKVKTAFNKEFDIVARQKEQEIARVKERNLRIREILSQLDLQVEVWEPALTDDERPERALTVQDSEIKVEKYLTQQEREKAEMLAKLEMERRLAAMDNERLRALNDMMGGVLEVKKEDILKMDIPPPSFISKPEHVWNDEEKKIFREHEKKVKELNEEKENYRRALENELEKLEASIQETTKNFDETVCKLSERKVKSEMVIYQEELKIVNLVYALLLDEELDAREAGLHNFLMKKENEKVKTARKILTAKNKIEAYTDIYENAVAEEKNLEHGFTKEFAGVPPDLLEELFQLYKHRPKTTMTEMLLDTAGLYGDCSGSAEDYKHALGLLMKAMDELDSPEHMPNGLDLSIWEHFCLARRSKMESEELVKWKALTLAEMEAFLQRRMDDNEKIKSEIEDIFQELTWLKEEKIKLRLNLAIQFLLKQGQVELESTEIPDYADAILINKAVIEDLNCSIMAQAEKKIASMVEYKDFSKGIFQLEWEHKKMRMQIEDLKQKARDIVTLPISEDRQLFLTVLNYDSRITHRISVMEQSLGIMDELHKKNVKNRQKRIKELEKCISLKEQENYELSLELKEMLVSVSERRHIFEAADTQHVSEKIAKQRYREILKQKHLRGLVKEQEKQFEILQAEAKRLRSGTFPAL
ncbi:cilia- and flagella-associated protein 43 isoform 9-T13 [Alca torda]